jgi:serine/threonine-protein kinase RIO1
MFNLNRVPPQEILTAEDYIDNPLLYGLMKRLPQELVVLHANKIESENKSDEEAIIYLKDILRKRESAVTVSSISDEEVKKQLEGRESEIFEHIENDLFFDQESQIGNGMTAKVKLYEIQTETLIIPTAVKYLVTPTSKTLSAQGEHDMIREVERMIEIEELERKDEELLPHVKVPHPYFHHRTENVQCYGMEYIDGVTLEQAVAGKWRRPGMEEDVLKSIKDLDLKQILNEIDLFYDNMHEYCLHGDMKPGNMMIDRDGKIYIIDFGQSVLISHIPDKAREQLEVLKEDERKISKDAIKRLFGLLDK